MRHFEAQGQHVYFEVLCSPRVWTSLTHRNFSVLGSWECSWILTLLTTIFPLSNFFLNFLCGPLGMKFVMILLELYYYF